MKNHKLYWQEIGNPNNPHLVLVHGWGTNSKVWVPLLEPLQQNYYVHLVDLPGYGQSPIVPTIETFNDFCELIYEQAPKGAFWIGWSLGGLVSTNIALNHSSSVKGLITMASSPCFIANNDWPGLDVKIFKQFADNLQEDPQATLKKFIALQCIGDKHAKTIQRLLLNLLDPSIAKSTLEFGLALLQQVDLREKIDELTVPHLSILGREDKIVPATIATSKSYVINQASHLPFLSSTEQCIKLISTFINTWL